jgi:hypothetical protein
MSLLPKCPPARQFKILIREFVAKKAVGYWRWLLAKNPVLYVTFGLNS